MNPLNGALLALMAFIMTVPQIIFDGGMMKNILRIGVPNACENSFFQFGRLIVASMIALFGTMQTSANAVANTLDSIGIIAGQAMSLAIVTVVGQCVGARDNRQVVYYVKKADRLELSDDG